MSILSLTDRFKNAWNAFTSRDPTEEVKVTYSEPSFSYRPDRIRLTRGNERSIITAIYNRIAIDCAAIDIKHVRLDENDNFVEEIKSGLNNVFTLEANIDQTGRAFVRDVVMSMFDEGCVALVPVDTTVNPRKTDSYEIITMRTGKIIQWYPHYVKVHLYNDRTGLYEDITLPKAEVGIIENPLYSVVNEPNSTLQRLIRKLNLLDYIDEQNSSGKLDLIIQLPYVIKSEAKQQQAKQRLGEIEMQLTGSKYGIAYIDGTERVTQLNRAVENNLLSQIEYLTSMLYGQLGVTDEIIKGTATDTTMLNYYNRTVEPILSAITEESKRKFLSKTARTQRQSIEFYRDPFKLVPVSQMAEIADKFTRNEILSSNEVRSIIAFKPSTDPKADELRNSNLNHPEESIYNVNSLEEQPVEEYEESASSSEDAQSFGDIKVKDLLAEK